MIKLAVSTAILYFGAIWLTGFLVGRHLDPDGYVVGVIMGCVFLFIGAITSSYCECNPLFMDLPEQLALKKILNVFGISTRMSAGHIQDVVEWSSKHTEIKALCIEIGARGQDATLSQRDYRLIRKATDKLENYEWRYRLWAQDAAQYRAAQQQMHDSGLAQQIKSRAEQIELQNNTIETPNQSAPPRL